MDGAGSAWPGFVCRARWLCETSWVLTAGAVGALGWRCAGSHLWDPLLRGVGTAWESSSSCCSAQAPGTGTSTIPRGCVSPLQAFPAFPDCFLPSRRHECPGLPPALSSRSRQDADPSSPTAAPRPPATPHPQSGRGHLAGQGGGLSPCWGHLPEELPLEKAGYGRGGVLWEVGMWSWVVPVPGGSQGGAELLLLSRQTQNRRS